MTLFWNSKLFNFCDSHIEPHKFTPGDIEIINDKIHALINDQYENRLAATKELKMNCYHCKRELIWGGDHDIDDSEEYVMVTNLSCQHCGSAVEVYTPRSHFEAEIINITDPK